MHVWRAGPVHVYLYAVCTGCRGQRQGGCREREKGNGENWTAWLGCVWHGSGTEGAIYSKVLWDLKVQKVILGAQEVKHGTEGCNITSFYLRGKTESNLSILKMPENMEYLEEPVLGTSLYTNTLGGAKHPSPSGFIIIQHKRGSTGKVEEGHWSKWA